MERSTAAGDYRYRVAGWTSVSGETATRLPTAMVVTVTSPRRIGNLRCFRVRRALADGVVQSVVFVVRGTRLYITEVQNVIGGHETVVRPDPPLLALDPDRLAWDGAFAGTTSGRYRAELLGRRTFRVGGRELRAVGVHLRLAFRGDIEGTEISTRWIARGSRLVVREEVEQRQRFGVDEFLLDYRAALRRTEPGSS